MGVAEEQPEAPGQQAAREERLVASLLRARLDGLTKAR